MRAIALLWAIGAAAPLVARPVYIIAHRCNGFGDVPQVVLEEGVNAIEADFRHGGGFIMPEGWYVEHDLVNPLSTPFGAWLAEVASAAPNLSLVIFDIKHPDGPIEQIYDAARVALPDVSLLFSIASFDERGAFARLKSRVQADSRAAVSIDEGANPADVQAFFESEGYVRYWYGDGVSAAVPIPERVENHVAAALASRGPCGAAKGVYTWTYESESSITRFLDQGVDGIFVNAPQCSGYVSPFAWAPSAAVAYARSLPGRSLGTRADQPFAVRVPERASVFVDSSNTGCGDGSEAHPHRTFADALNGVIPAGTLHLFPGTYRAAELLRAVAVGRAGLSGTATITR